MSLENYEKTDFEKIKRRLAAPNKIFNFGKLRQLDDDQCSAKIDLTTGDVGRKRYSADVDYGGYNSNANNSTYFNNWYYQDTSKPLRYNNSMGVPPLNQEFGSNFEVLYGKPIKRNTSINTASNTQYYKTDFQYNHHLLSAPVSEPTKKKASTSTSVLDPPPPTQNVEFNDKYLVIFFNNCISIAKQLTLIVALAEIYFTLLSTLTSDCSPDELHKFYRDLDPKTTFCDSDEKDSYKQVINNVFRSFVVIPSALFVIYDALPAGLYQIYRQTYFDSVRLSGLASRLNCGGYYGTVYLKTLLYTILLANSFYAPSIQNSMGPNYLLSSKSAFNDQSRISYGIFVTITLVSNIYLSILHFIFTFKKEYEATETVNEYLHPSIDVWETEGGAIKWICCESMTEKDQKRKLFDFAYSIGFILFSVGVAVGQQYLRTCWKAALGVHIFGFIILFLSFAVSCLSYDDDLVKLIFCRLSIFKQKEIEEQQKQALVSETTPLVQGLAPPSYEEAMKTQPSSSIEAPPSYEEALKSKQSSNIGQNVPPPPSYAQAVEAGASTGGQHSMSISMTASEYHGDPHNPNPGLKSSSNPNVPIQGSNINPSNPSSSSNPNVPIQGPNPNLPDLNPYNPSSTSKPNIPTQAPNPNLPKPNLSNPSSISNPNPSSNYPSKIKQEESEITTTQSQCCSIYDYLQFQRYYLCRNDGQNTLISLIALLFIVQSASLSFLAMTEKRLNDDFGIRGSLCSGVHKNTVRDILLLNSSENLHAWLDISRHCINLVAILCSMVLYYFIAIIRRPDIETKHQTIFLFSIFFSVFLNLLVTLTFQHMFRKTISFKLIGTMHIRSHGYDDEIEAQIFLLMGISAFLYCSINQSSCITVAEEKVKKNEEGEEEKLGEIMKANPVSAAVEATTEWKTVSSVKMVSSGTDVESAYSQENEKQKNISRLKKNFSSLMNEFKSKIKQFITNGLISLLPILVGTCAFFIGLISIGFSWASYSSTASRHEPSVSVVNKFVDDANNPVSTTSCSNELFDLVTSIRTTINPAIKNFHHASVIHGSMLEIWGRAVLSSFSMMASLVIVGGSMCKMWYPVIEHNYIMISSFFLFPGYINLLLLTPLSYCFLGMLIYPVLQLRIGEGYALSNLSYILSLLSIILAIVVREFPVSSPEKIHFTSFEDSWEKITADAAKMKQMNADNEPGGFENA